MKTAKRTISVFNLKGGVGKTTTAISLAAGLAMQGRRVLLIDLDPQSHITSFFSVKEPKKDTFAFLTNGAEISECALPAGKNLDVILGSDDMKGAEFSLMQKPSPTLCLKEKLSAASYDYVIIDCPPSAGILAQNALHASNEVFVPVATEPLALLGLRQTIRTVEDFKSHAEHSIAVTRIIPTLFDRRNKICRKVLQELFNTYYELVSEPIRINTRLKEAPAAKKSIFTYAPKSAGAEDYSRIVRDTLSQEESLGEEGQAEPQLLKALA